MVECFLTLPDEECYLNFPTTDHEDSPLNFENIREKQQADAELLEWKRKFPERYIDKQIGRVRGIICYVKPGEDPRTQWKIALPASMLEGTVKWFHQITGHPGITRLRITLNARYYHPELRGVVDALKCNDCQQHKLEGKGYGLLPERELRSEPFQEVAADLVGPWKINVQGKEIEFKALMIIDTVTKLVPLGSSRYL